VTATGPRTPPGPATALPAHHRLGRIVRALARHLPGQMAGLLDHQRFAAGVEALARLADPAHLDPALAVLPDVEADRLADRLLERWSRIADPVLDPEAALVAPAEIWIGREPVRVALELVVDGADPGWEAVWDGATPSGDGARAILTVDPTAESAAARAHIRARTGAIRLALTAVARIEVRRPAVTVRDDRRRLVVADHRGRPAAGVTVRVGETEHRSGPGGLVELDEAPPTGAPLRVEGIFAGRIGDDP